MKRIHGFIPHPLVYTKIQAYDTQASIFFSPNPLDLPHLSAGPSKPSLSPMATVLESLVVPRSSALPSSAFPSLTSSPVCFGRRGSARLPEYSGLKIQLSHATRSVFSVGRSSRGGRRVGGVVCEAQDTAVEG